MGRVLIVGLDGATWDIIKPLASAGRLPNLARMVATGATGTLRSTVPPVTPAAWTSVFTGKNPGKHGIFDFQDLDPSTYEFTTVRTDRHREKTIWQLLGENELRSIVVDVPFTYPPKPLNGLMLTGYGTPRTADTVFTYPADLAQLIPEDLKSQIHVALPADRFDRSERFIDAWEEIMEGRRRLLTYLVGEEAWDFFMVVFSITDNMAHVFWTYVDPAHPNYYRPEGERYREAFLHSYEQCDRLLGELMEAAGPDTTTIVLSDHGFGSVRPRQYIYARLLDGGFLQARKDGGGVVLRDRLTRLGVELYTRFPFLREWVKGLAPKQRKRLKGTLERTGIMPTDSSVDYAQSLVIPTNFGLRMWINDAERFAHGIVPAREREAVLKRLITFLEADRDEATGRPIISAVFRGDGLYTGPYAENGPDLVIEYNNLYDPAAGTNAARNPHVEGGHTLDGILLAAGPGVQLADVQGASLVDIMPTVLHLLGLEVPPDVDGQVLTQILSSAYMVEHPVRRGETPAQHDRALAEEAYTSEQEEEIRKQLRQLGYL